MKAYTPEERAAFYAEEFPKWPPVQAHGKWVNGVWVIGNNYKGSGYYGAYPPNYLKRMGCMFPDAESVLHLFSGSLQKDPNYTRVDINPTLEPDVVCDATELGTVFEENTFDLIYADPPYTATDAKRYGTKMINRRAVIKSCTEVLQVGGYIVWLDERLPMYSKVKDGLELVGAFGIVRSTNHRTRFAFWFRKDRPHNYPDPYKM